MKSSTTTDNRIALYQAHHAMIIAEDALASLVRLDEAATGQDLLLKLWTAFYLNYAKPFLRVSRSDREEYMRRVVPDECRRIHDEIYFFRHHVSTDSEQGNLGGGGHAPGSNFKHPNEISAFQGYWDCVKEVQKRMAEEIRGALASPPAGEGPGEPVEESREVESIL